MVATSNPPAPDPNPERRPLWRRKWFLAATALVVIAGLLGTWLVVRDDTKRTDPGAALVKGAAGDPTQDVDGDPDPDDPNQVAADGADPSDIVGAPFESDTIDRGGPATIAAISPTSGAAGATVHITGTSLDRVVKVAFNGTPVTTFNAISSEEIVTSVPPNATTGTIRVSTTRGDTTSAQTFAATSPAITSFSPGGAAAGTSITINGANLGGTSSVSFGGVDTTPTAVTANSVVVTVPANAVTGHVSVRNGTTTTVSSNDFLVGSPSITAIRSTADVNSATKKAIEPNAAAPGEWVTLFGANFISGSTIRFGGQAADDSKYISATQYQAHVSGAALSGRVTISAGNGTATSPNDFVIAPRPSAISPRAQAPGSMVTITGVNLGATTSVSFAESEQQARFNVVSETELQAWVPDDAVNGVITVMNSGGRGSTPSDQKLSVTPVIADVQPSSGQAGTVVTVTGTNLAGVTSLKYGTTNVTATSVTSRELRFTVPNGATSQVISFTGAGGTATGPTFTIEALVDTPLAGTDPGTSPLTAPTSAGGSTATSTVVSTSTSTQLGGGLRFDRTSGTVTNGVFNGNGTAVLGSLTFPASLSYTSPGNWTLTATAAGSMTIGGTTVRVDGWTGSIAAAGGTTTWTQKFKVASSAALIASKITILGASVRLVPTCPSHASATLCGSSTTAAYVRLDAPTATTTAPASGLAVALAFGTPNAAAIPFRAVLDPVSGVFGMTATYAADAVAELGLTKGPQIRKMTLTVARNDSSRAQLDGEITAGGTFGGYDVLISGVGQISVPKMSAYRADAMAAKFVDGGVIVTARLARTAGVAGFAATSVAYFRADASAKVAGSNLQVASGTFVFAGSMAAPTWTKYVGLGNASLGGYATYSEFSNELTVAAVAYLGLRLPPVPGMETRINSLVFSTTMSIDGTSLGYTATISGQGTVAIGGRQATAIEIAGTFDPVENAFTLAFSAGTADGNVVWPDVFGVSGFDMNTLVVSIGVSDIFPFLSVGLGGSGTVPQSLRGMLGMDTSKTIPTKFAANLSVTSPCLQIEMGTPGSNTPILALPGNAGIISVNYATLAASVDGCRIGTLGSYVDVAPGVVIGASGTMFGMPVSGFAMFDPTPVGPFQSPTLLAWFDVSARGNFGIQMDASYRVTVAAGGWTPLPKITLRGGLTIGTNAHIDISGSCEVTTSGPTCSGAGIGSLSFGGFGLDMLVSVQNLFTDHPFVSAAASVRIIGVKLVLAGSFGSAPAPTATSADAGLTYSFSASGKFPGFILDSFIFSVERSADTGWNTRSRIALGGSLGGSFGKAIGTSGRWMGSTDFTPVSGSVTIPIAFTLPLGVVDIPINLNMRVCLSGSCAGTVKASLDMKVEYLRLPFDIKGVDLDPTNWKFNYHYAGSVSKSGSTGNSWGGAKGSVQASIDLTITESSITLKHASASAKGYVGLGGKWNYLGTLGVDIKSDGKFCVKISKWNMCF